MISDRLDELILMKKNGNVTIEDALKITGLPRKQFFEQVKQMNVLLNQESDLKILSKNGRIQIPNLKYIWDRIKFELTEEIILEGETRVSFIYLIIYAGFQKINLEDLQELLFVSKNTIINDLKKLKKKLPQGMELLFSRKSGYFFRGKEEHIRQQAYHLLQKMESREFYASTSKFINEFFPGHLTLLTKFFDKFHQERNQQSVLSRSRPVILFLGLSKNRLPEDLLADPTIVKLMLGSCEQVG